SIAPAGMTFNPATRLVEWNPTPDQLGEHTVEIQADDGRGGVAIQSIMVRVTTVAANEPPQIVSTPVLNGTIDRPYIYNLLAEDAEGDPLVWSLTTALHGLSIHPNLGTLRWTPEADQEGVIDVVVLVTDAQGGRATQAFTITVSPLNLPPGISSTPPTQAIVG